MAYLLHVNKPTKRAVAHPPYCPYSLRPQVSHEANFWQRFDSEMELDSEGKRLKREGFDFHRCTCNYCQKAAADSLLRLHGIAKDVFASLGGGEEFIRRERENWYGDKPDPIDFFK